MIVRCERCETRFKLDESRLPARGARVRCSRCKHAFFVTPPGATPEAVALAVAAEAVRRPSRAPEPAWDLEEAAGSTFVSPRQRKADTHPPASDAGADDEESDWRFEDEVPALDTTAPSLALGLDASGAAPALDNDPNETSLADLGDPTTWDLLTTAQRAPSPPLEAPAPEPTLSAPPLPVTPSVTAREPGMAAPPAQATEPALLAPAPAPLEALPELPRRSLQAAWVALAVLTALAAWGGLRPPGAGSVGAIPAIPGFALLEVRARGIESVAGELLVVSGRLRNTGTVARAPGALQVLLLDAGGAALPGVASPAGPVLAVERLREEPPDALREAQARASAAWASGLVAPGAEVAFDAVFGASPPQAARYSFRPEGGGGRD